MALTTTSKANAIEQAPTVADDSAAALGKAFVAVDRASGHLLEWRKTAAARQRSPQAVGVPRSLMLPALATNAQSVAASTYRSKRRD
jgi:hypothetical protein